jgi:hypothetical protein
VVSGNNKRVSVLLLSAIAVATASGAEAADREPTRQRMAVAIRGGASMGAYEAGFNWTGLKLMRTTGQVDEWSMGGKPYEIELVSLAGASAGGINTLLSSLTWCALPGAFPDAVADNVFRDVWLTPDVNRGGGSGEQNGIT